MNDWLKTYRNINSTKNMNETRDLYCNKSTKICDFVRQMKRFYQILYPV